MPQSGPLSPFLNRLSDLITQVAAETGTATDAGAWSALRVAQAIAAQTTDISLPVLYDSGAIGAPAASIDSGAGGFSQAYSHLIGFHSLRGTNAVINQAVDVDFNADAVDGNYRWHVNYWGSSIGTSVNQTNRQWLEANGASSLANQPTSGFFVVPDYSSTTWEKQLIECRMADRTSGSYIVLVYGVHWIGTAGLNRIQLTPTVGNLDTASRLALYGVG